MYYTANHWDRRILKIIKVYFNSLKQKSQYLLKKRGDLCRQKLIHFAVQQKLTLCHKETILQQKFFFNYKKITQYLKEGLTLFSDAQPRTPFTFLPSCIESGHQFIDWHLGSNQRLTWGFLGGSVVKNLSVNAGDTSLAPGSEGSHVPQSS